MVLIHWCQGQSNPSLLQGPWLCISLSWRSKPFWLHDACQLAWQLEGRLIRLICQRQPLCTILVQCSYLWSAILNMNHQQPRHDTLLLKLCCQLAQQHDNVSSTEAYNVKDEKQFEISIMNKFKISVELEQNHYRPVLPALILVCDLQHKIKWFICKWLDNINVN
jgi:hypothetical protein